MVNEIGKYVSQLVGYFTTLVVSDSTLSLKLKKERKFTEEKSICHKILFDYRTISCTTYTPVRPLSNSSNKIVNT